MANVRQKENRKPWCMPPKCMRRYSRRCRRRSSLPLWTSSSKRRLDNIPASLRITEEAALGLPLLLSKVGLHHPNCRDARFFDASRGRRYHEAGVSPRGEPHLLHAEHCMTSRLLQAIALNTLLAILFSAALPQADLAPIAPASSGAWQCWPPSQANPCRHHLAGVTLLSANDGWAVGGMTGHGAILHWNGIAWSCLLYTSDAADERSSVDLGGRRIIKKKTVNEDWCYAEDRQ